MQAIMDKIKGEFAEFEKDRKIARMDSIITLANAVKEASLRDTKAQVKRELAEIDQQLTQLKGMEHIPGIDTVILDLQTKRSSLLAKCGAGGAAQAAKAAPRLVEEAEKPSRQYFPRTEVEVEISWGDLVVGGAAQAAKPAAKPAGGAGDKRPKHVVPCNSGTACKYGLACTYKHTPDELASFKRRTTK